MKEPTQTERVLKALRQAGDRGLRSDAAYSLHIPRLAARILDLKDQGYEISSEREGKYTRYKLASVGHRGEGRGEPLRSTAGAANATPASVSGEASAGATPLAPADPARLFEDEVKPRSQYDAWSDAA